jgi:hypothetical protein
MCVASKFKLDFSDQEQEEIEAMWFEGFEPDPTEPQSRSVWVAIGHMALGKAQRIEDGEYGEPEDDMDDNEEWSDQLRGIASVIFNEFRAGDGKI